jgi:hypothetical protein
MMVLYLIVFVIVLSSILAVLGVSVTEQVAEPYRRRRHRAHFQGRS